MAPSTQTLTGPLSKAAASPLLDLVTRYRVDLVTETGTDSTISARERQ